jgi:signal transduction histidine kinase
MRDEAKLTRRRHAPAALAFLLALNLLCGLCRADEPAMTLVESDFILDDSTTPPPQTAPWQRQPLPDNWNLSRPGTGGNGWYRLHFHLQQRPEHSYAIYVPKLSMNAAFYVNGALVGSGGHFEEPMPRHWNRPQFFTVSPALLEPGDNVVHVRLWAYPNSRGGLGMVTIGPQAELRPWYERLYFVQTLLPQLCNIVVAALGLFAFALWVRRRTEPTYVLFFVFSLVWALRSTHMLIRDIPVNTFYWDIWVQSSFGWCALLFVTLAMRYCGLRWPRFEKLLLIYGALGPICMYLGGPTRLHLIANNWSFVIVPVAIFFEIFLLREALRRRTTADVVLASVWALIVAASVHDGLVHRDKLAFDSFYFVSYAMILLSFVMGWILINRFVQALNVAEQLNLELEQRVARKHAELTDNFQRLKRLEREHAIAEERERLMSEMHDGLGSRLIASLHLIEQGDTARDEIAEALRECLDSLRLTIHSLEPTDDDLLSVLASLRYRVEARLRKRGITLVWRVNDIPKIDSLTPQNVLHILRILQEAFTNIVKHAKAKTITVRTGSGREHVFIEVLDDGCGFVCNREGRGLVSMRKRAHALSAQLELTSTPSGTRLMLQIPCAAKPARPDDGRDEPSETMRVALSG